MNVKPTFRTWDGEGSLVQFVVSLNLHRRHLQPLQRAGVATNMLPLLEKEARERQATSTGGINPQLVANLPQADKGKSRDQAAEIVGVSARYVSDMKRYSTNEPEIFDLAMKGVINGSLNWWLGDWLNEGEKRYGETYSQAIEVTGHKLENLKQCAWVSGRVKSCTRVHDLTWTHHRHVAHLDEQAQQALLQAAVEHEGVIEKGLNLLSQGYKSRVGLNTSTCYPPLKIG